MDSEREQAYRSWKKFLDPDDLKANLVRASVYLSSYELLKWVIVERPRQFFSTVHLQKKYKAEVIALHSKDPFHASCLWFQKMQAIDGDDATMVEEIRRHRNDIAHELPKYLTDSRFVVNMQLLDSVHFLVGKIERWWIREIEMPVNPDFDPVDVGSIPDREIQSGIMIVMDVIHKVVHGQDQELRQLLEKLKDSGDSGDTIG